MAVLWASACKLDSDTLTVDGSKIRVFEHRDKVQLPGVISAYYKVQWAKDYRRTDLEISRTRRWKGIFLIRSSVLSSRNDTPSPQTSQTTRPVSYSPLGSPSIRSKLWLNKCHMRHSHCIHEEVKRGMDDGWEGERVGQDIETISE